MTERPSAQSRATMKYIKDKQKQIVLRYRKEEFEEHILPAIQQAEMPVATFIKAAVEEKIKRECENHDKNGEDQGTGT